MADRNDRPCSLMLWHKLYSAMGNNEDPFPVERLDALVSPFASEPAYCRCKEKNCFHLVYKFPDHSLLHAFCVGSSVVSFYSYGPWEGGRKSLDIRWGPHGFELGGSWSRTQHVTKQLAEEWSGKSC